MKIRFITKKMEREKVRRKLQQAEKIAAISKILPSVLYDKEGREFLKVVNREYGTISYLNHEFIEERLGDKMRL